MNIKQISYFVSAAQLGSMSAAAREKGISTQAMSKALSDLRKELPAPLFERIPQGIKLTAFGKQFLEKAKPVCESFSQLENMSDSNPNDPQLALLLVAPAFSDNESAREKLALFFERYLHTKARVDLGTGEEGIAALARGECDAIITIGTLDDGEHDCFIAGTMPVGACMANNHPLANRASIALDELKPYPVLASKTFDHFNNSIVVTYRREGLLERVIEPNEEDMPRLFYQEHGVFLMLNVPMLGEMLPHTTTVPLDERTAKPISLCLVTEKDVKSEAYRKLEKLLKSGIR